MGAQPSQRIRSRPNLADVRSRAERASHAGPLPGSVPYPRPLSPSAALRARGQESKICLLPVGLDLLIDQPEASRLHEVDDLRLVRSALILPVRRHRRLELNFGHVFEPVSGRLHDVEVEALSYDLQVVDGFDDGYIL